MRTSLLMDQLQSAAGPCEPQVRDAVNHLHVLFTPKMHPSTCSYSGAALVFKKLKKPQTPLKWHD